MEAYKDDYFEFFRSEDEMKRKVRTGDYIQGKVAKIKLRPLLCSPVTAHVVKEELSLAASTDAIRDTMENSGLVAEITVQGEDGDEKRNMLIRNTALRSLLTRARVSGSSFARMTPEEKSNVLNLCLRKWPRAKALFYVDDEKISAVLSGSKFCPLPQEKLFSVLTETLQKSYKGYKFMGAYHDHTLTTVNYELPASCNKILDAYRSALLHGSSEEMTDLALAIQFITSDIGQRGAAIHCFIIKSGRRIPLGFVNGVDHNRKATINDFKHAAGNIFAAMQKNVDRIKGLLEIHLVYPENAMLAIAKSEDFPKVAAMEAIKMFSDINRGAPTTAHNVFYALNETIYLMKPRPAEHQRLYLEDKIAKLLNINWKSYDMALPVKW